MQKSGKKPQAAHRKVKTSNTRSRRDLQRPSTQRQTEAVAAQMASSSKKNSQNTKNTKNVQGAKNTKSSNRNKAPKNTVAKRSEEIAAEESAKIIITANRTMAERPHTKKRTVSIIEHESEPEIIVATPRIEEEPDDVELLTLPESESDLVPTNISQVSAKELKERAIAKALSEAARPREKKIVERPMRTHFNWPRIILALTCAAAAVFAIVYFVNINSPDISFKVAAMQTGIEASYPSYVPRDYSLSDITSENGKITLNFKNASTGGAFTLIEEKSAWDSNTLMNNYVRAEYDNDYTMIREQGLTLFISGSDAAWVNGGVVYKLKTTSGSLTKKQIKAIAVSL